MMLADTETEKTRRDRKPKLASHLSWEEVIGARELLSDSRLL